MKTLKKYPEWLIAGLWMCISVLGVGDNNGLIQLNKDTLNPLETLQITVFDVNDVCQIHVTNPAGIVQTFTGTIQSGQCTASYVPNYLPGIYEIYAQTTGPVPQTETDTFTVSYAQNTLAISNWQCNQSSYAPGREMAFTFNLTDALSQPISGLSSQITDTQTDVTGGGLSIMRRIIGVNEDGTAIARLQIYFDTTGGWSDIYAGTEVRIGLYNTDGSTPLSSQIIRTTGFENNGGNYLSSTLTDTEWTVRVESGFAGSDKIAYLDFEVPPTASVSDILFSVNYIKYYYNPSWADRIYIGEQYIAPSQSGMELNTGSVFGTLGRFPIYLPMTPNENGLLYYRIRTTQTIGEQTINDGAISENAGLYTNRWVWQDYINTTAYFSVYADKWGYRHAYSGAIEIGPDGGTGQSNLNISNFTSNTNTYFPGDTLDFSFLLTDSQSQPVSGFTGVFEDAIPEKTGGALYILRQFRDAQPDGSSVARLLCYFDTTGGWSDIYAGTTVQIRLFEKDGVTPLDEAVTVTEGFLNNDDAKLSSQFVDNVWTVQVDSNFTGNDKIAYLEFAIPASRSVSDIVFSVERILYFRNSGWGDEIYITAARATESSFPINILGQIEFAEGSTFPGLGQLPVKLTLNPNPNGFVFYHFSSPDIPENNINYGTLSSVGNQYHNLFRWNDYLVTTANVFCYADGWRYLNHTVSPGVNLAFDTSPRERLIKDYTLDKRGYTLNETRKLSATVEDGYGNPKSDLTFKEAITDSNSGKLSIVSQHVRSTSEGLSILRLLMVFDTTGSWSDIYSGTQVKLSLYGADGKSAVPAEIQIAPGSQNAEGYLTSTLTNNSGIYSWDVDVVQNFASSDRLVWLDFLIPDPMSGSAVVYAVESIKYFCNTGWADAVTIKNQTVAMANFPQNYTKQYEFNTGSLFGTLGRFPLFLSLNPGDGAIYPKMIASRDETLSGTMSVASRRYTYSQQLTEAGIDYATMLCMAKYGFFDNECRCTESINLLFTGEPRYLGGLVTEPIMLGETWQKNLHDYFFVEQDYNQVEYLSSDPRIQITGNIAVFSPQTTDDTSRDVVITAVSKINPAVTVASDPFTLYAANCTSSYDCSDPNGRPTACMDYQCQAYDMRSSYRLTAQGVDLSIFNKNITLSNSFPSAGETITLCAEVFNTGTTNVFDVTTEFYLDDVNSIPIDSNSVNVIPTTYMDLPFESHQACIAWTVPSDLSGAHRIWVKVSGDYPLDMEEDMLSNNYATVDFYVNDPLMNEPNAALAGGCPSAVPMPMMAMSSSMELFNQAPSCQTLYMLIPIYVQVCENETLCGPVTGIELGYWSTLYWPSWSGYCQEFGVPQEAITDLIRTYEKIYSLGSKGALGDPPSWTDIPGYFEKPEGWSDGWLPCHPEPTLFPTILYAPGVVDPGCGGLCPVSAWDCGEGVHFQPRFDSPLYHAYEFKVSGGARKVTRCQTKADVIKVPYQVCYTPGDRTPFRLPFNPFGGGPGGENGCCYGGNGPGLPGSGPGGTPPLRFEIAGPPTDMNGNPLPFGVSFCSSGTGVSNDLGDVLLITPDGGGLESGILLQKGWNQFAPLLASQSTTGDRLISLHQGWNFFGYSSTTPLLWSNAVVIRETQEKTIADADEAGWIQGVVYTLDNNTLTYQFIPGQDDFLRNKRAYWLYAKVDGLTLKLPSVGGSPDDASLLWADMLVSNGIQTITTTEAIQAGWIDESISFIDAQGYKKVPQDANSIHAWQGYWLWCNQQGLRLYLPSQPQPTAESAQAQFAVSEPEVELVKVGTQPGLPAPDFVLADTLGNKVSLADFRGKDVLLVFGNTQCPNCRGKLPLLNELHKKGDFKVVYVVLGATSKAAQKFVSDNKVTFTVLVDSNQLVGRIYGITMIPEAFVIDPVGLIQHQTTTEGPALWYLLAGQTIPESMLPDK